MSRRKLRTRTDGERVTFRTFAEPGLFLLPFLIGLLVFTVYPFINVILLSFRQDYSLMTGEFSGIGLGNYAEIFHDANFLNGLRNTALYVLFVVPIVTVLSLFLASLLNSCTKLQGLFQTCYFLPMVTSVTAVGLVWKWMFNYDYGLINYALSLFGISPVNWLNDPHYNLAALIIYGIWSMLPFTIILLLSGFQNRHRRPGLRSGNGGHQPRGSSADDQHSFHGYQWRTQYIKDIPETNTNIAVSYYRYTNDGYFSFNEANTRNWDYNSRQKSEIQFNISQTIFDGVSLYASGSQQDYWGNNDKNRNISVGVSGQQWGVGYSLNYQYSRYTDQNNDRALSLNLSIPLERWLPRSRVSYQMTSQKDRPTQHEMRLDGSLLDDGRLSYSLEQSLDDDNNHNSSLNASYRSPYGTFSAGYSYGNDSSQYNYGVTGGVVIHPHGVTLSQYLGNAFALIDANGAYGVRIQNYPGIATDPFGYAVVPYLTTYQENRLSVDTTQLPDNVDLEQTTQFVVPNRGAMVAARFNANIGYRVLVTVSDRNGKPLPFGALASNDETGQQSIVDEGGILYLSGISSKSQSWTVRWGNQADQQCQFAFSTPDSEPTTSVLQGTAQCH